MNILHENQGVKYQVFHLSEHLAKLRRRVALSSLYYIGNKLFKYFVANMAKNASIKIF